MLHSCPQVRWPLLESEAANQESGSPAREEIKVSSAEYVQYRTGMNR